MNKFRDLGEFSGLVDLRRSGYTCAGTAHSSDLSIERNAGQLLSQKSLLHVLGVPSGFNIVPEVRVENSWIKNSVYGEELSWSVGFGPRSHGWLLMRPDQTSRAPGILALHDHANIKCYGKEKIAIGRLTAAARVIELREKFYGGRAFANELARRGFVVFCHDVFMWGSRKFSYKSMPERVQRLAEEHSELMSFRGFRETGLERYEIAARYQEDVIAKYCSALGLSLAGLILREDMIALNYLQSRQEVVADKVGCIGLSGGGTRAALLRAVAEQPLTTVLVGAMATLRSLLDHNVANHSWLLFPPGLASIYDWPELVASGKPSSLLVQYNKNDDHFPLDGMREAHRRLLRYFSEFAPRRYEGVFYPGPHKFDVAMQEDSFRWMQEQF